MINNTQIKASFLVLVILTMVSCNKEDGNRMSIGNLIEEDYKLHNSTITGVDNGIVNYESVQIDVDDDGVNDFEFRSYEDSVAYPEKEARHWVNVLVINSAFRLAHTANSGNRSLKGCSTTYDYFGTYPRETIYCSVECSDEGNEDYSIPDHTATYEKGEFIYLIESWTEQDELTVAYYGGSDGGSMFNETDDTLVSTITYLPDGCNNPPSVGSFYISFIKDHEDNTSIGWIELDVDYTGKLIILRSAIKAIS